MRTTMKRLPALSVVLAGLAAGALAACSGAPAYSSSSSSRPQPATTGTAGGNTASNAPGGAASSSPDSNSRVPTASATYCSRVPSSLIQSTLRLAVGKQQPVIEGPVAVCAYAGKYEVLVRYQINENATQFSQDKKAMTSLHQTVATITGLGDSAFSATLRTGSPATITLAARKGTVAIFITSPASLASERALMTILLNQL
ncbi:MAG TPA: hypothetical protein VF070_26515 [Streptosporangiaceae bacterium]